jgi:hypothetical protein
VAQVAQKYTYYMVVCVLEKEAGPMTATELLHGLQQQHIVLTVEGDSLHYDAPQGAMTPEVLAALRQYKSALLALLSPASPPQDADLACADGGVPQAPVPAQQPLPPEERQAQVDERAGIYEVDGGMSRAAAEVLAAHGLVTGLPPCPRCGVMSYVYEDGYQRCTNRRGCGGTP